MRLLVASVETVASVNGDADDNFAISLTVTEMLLDEISWFEYNTRHTFVTRNDMRNDVQDR